LAKRRVPAFIAQALLSLLLLTWLPVAALSDLQESFLLQVGDPLSSQETSGPGEADEEACWQGWSDPNEGPDDFALPRPSAMAAPFLSAQRRDWRILEALLRLDSFGFLRATGPPLL
jgi:hypothetical protein